jgi:hypothetical protein
VRLLTIGTLRGAFAALSVGAALAFGAASAVSQPESGAKCPSGTVGACTTQAQCKSICSSLGFPIEQSQCAFVSGRGCCICSLSPP